MTHWLFNSMYHYVSSGGLGPRPLGRSAPQLLQFRCLSGSLVLSLSSPITQRRGCCSCMNTLVYGSCTVDASTRVQHFQRRCTIASHCTVAAVCKCGKASARIELVTE